MSFSLSYLCSPIYTVLKLKNDIKYSLPTLFPFLTLKLQKAYPREFLRHSLATRVLLLATLLQRLEIYYLFWKFLKEL